MCACVEEKKERGREKNKEREKKTRDECRRNETKRVREREYTMRKSDPASEGRMP